MQHSKAREIFSLVFHSFSLFSKFSLDFLVILSVSVEEVLVFLEPMRSWETLEGPPIVLCFFLSKLLLVLLI